MRQAIVTKFVGPTNSRGSRVRAKASAGSITVNWDHSLNVDGNHTAAAFELALKLGWKGFWTGGGMPNGDGNCYINASDTAPEKFRADEAFWLGAPV